jgi:hypothetical protein
MWELQPLTTLRASKACRGENFTLPFMKSDIHIQTSDGLGSRSQWPRGLRHELSSSVWTLGLCVRVPHEAWIVRLFCVCVVLCVGCGLAMGWSPVQGVLTTTYRITKTEKAAKAKQGAVKPLMNGWPSVVLGAGLTRGRDNHESRNRVILSMNFLYFILRSKQTASFSVHRIRFYFTISDWQTVRITLLHTVIMSTWCRELTFLTRNNCDSGVFFSVLHCSGIYGDASSV